MILAILQARLSSSRLPGKVMLPVHGKPMILRQTERALRARMVDRLIVATSVGASDDGLVDLCAAEGIEVFRGSLEDVLDRYYRAAQLLRPDHVLRLTGDCPLTDPLVIDAVIDFHLSGEFDYTSNSLAPTFPDGLDVEVMTFPALQCAWTEATLPSQREHVTPYVYQSPDRFRIGSYRQADDQSDLRWTVDEREDHDLICRIYDALYPSNPCFTSNDVLRLLNERPELKTINMRYMRNEGYRRSLQEDAALTVLRSGQT